MPFLEAVSSCLLVLQVRACSCVPLVFSNSLSDPSCTQHFFLVVMLQLSLNGCEPRFSVSQNKYMTQRDRFSDIKNLHVLEV
jgi:hypothetical protein